MAIETCSSPSPCVLVVLCSAHTPSLKALLFLPFLFSHHLFFSFVQLTETDEQARVSPFYSHAAVIGYIGGADLGSLRPPVHLLIGFVDAINHFYASFF